jgi:prepilin-type N-terminal cleavage/methylation domain-containing protein
MNKHLKIKSFSKSNLLSSFVQKYFSHLACRQAGLPSTVSLQKGFTLLEVLVVLVIFLTVGGTVVSVLSIALRGAKKTDVVMSVKQNGDFALNEMIRSIRYASDLTSPAVCYPPVSANSVSIVSNSDYQTTQYSCPADPTGPISSNSAALIDTSAVKVTSCSFTCSQPVTGGPPNINIKFTLTSLGQTNFFESQSTRPFESTVTLRNVTR